MSLGAALTEGYLVNDRFLLLRLLGRGGMGSVWVARHLSLNIDVAIKFIDGALAGREDLRSRFAQEARTAARIQSPHVVNILDYGFDGESPFIVMELLQGEPLGARLERERHLPPGEVAAILTQAARGLTRAHALGIVHRDLKPDNLFLCRDEEGGVHVKLLDFGIARDDSPLGVGPAHRTGTGQLLGTPAYMSPEQALGRPHIDLRSDLYSLAVVAYHCLVGRLPFDTDAIGELIVSISTQEPPSASSFAPGLAPGVDVWFRRAFQKDPASRFQSAKEMADAFVLACRASSPAFDRTVLARGEGITTPDFVRPGVSPGPTMASAGVVVAPRAPTTADGAIPGHPASRAPGLVPAGGAPTAAWSPVVVVAPGASRMPDTFNGHSATHAGSGRPARRQPGLAGIVVAVLAVFVLALVGGTYVARYQGRGATGPTAAGSASDVTAPTVTLAPQLPPPLPALPVSPSASPASASASADAAAPPPPRPQPLPPRPAPSTRPPKNDYGL